MKYVAAVITVSDRCYKGETEDHSGPALVQALTAAGIEVGNTETVPDESSTIATVLQKYVSDPVVHVIFTTDGSNSNISSFGPAMRAVGRPRR